MNMVYAKLAVVALAFVAGWWVASQYYGVRDLQHQVAGLQADKEALNAVLTETQRLQTVAQDEAARAQDRLRVVDTERTQLVGTVDRLRVQLRAATGSSSNAAPTIGGQSEPGADACNLRADVSIWLADRIADLAEYADRLKVAGQTCEAIHDSL